MMPLGIVGASARAAAVSAVRAGFAPWAIDLFADRDLRRIAQVTRCLMDEYPSALPHYADQMPPGPVMYTGGLENYPDVVRELAAHREVWGNSADALPFVRNPFLLPIFPTPPRVSHLGVVPARDACPPTGRWVRKRLRSAGGLGIRFAEPGELTSTGHFFQQFADGLPMSALFVPRPSNRQLLFLGVTEQLIGESWLHAEPFAYCGNVGPVSLPDEVFVGLRDYASRIAAESGMRGVWGVDFIFDDTTAFPVELNPRYTASLEVLELANNMPYLIFHAKEFTPSVPSPAFGDGDKRDVVGKAIYYAPHAITFPAGPWDDELSRTFDPWRVPDFADIPDAGSLIEAGAPVLTLFATGDTPAAVRRELQSRAAELDDLWA